MKRAARIDENQPDIVRALRAMGASVQPLHAVGGGCPDLAVGWAGKTYLMEIKNPKKPKGDQQLTTEQQTWHRAWNGHVVVVRTPEDATWYLMQLNARK